MKKILVFLALIVFTASAVFIFLNRSKTTSQVQVNSFEDCVKAGNPVMESYPERCIHEGVTFTKDIGNEMEKQDLITIVTPRPNQTIESPLIITGTARGTWFFEASFPISLLDENDQEIAMGIATAQGEWMTEEFVPFTAEITYSTQSLAGKLVLKKDNPSGLPENDDQLVIPVRFK